MIATIGTGLVNFMMSLVSNIWAIGFLWILNGYFQSIFGEHATELLSYYYSGKEHHLISTGMSLSMVAGYVLSWAVFRQIAFRIQLAKLFPCTRSCGSVYALPMVLFRGSRKWLSPGRSSS